tara:strand:- start:32278 stop:32793 length:516 start_codon:yes stop_codon:yes gene_type:complete
MILSKLLYIMIISNKNKKYIIIILIMTVFFMCIINSKIKENYNNINGKVIHGSGISTKMVDYPTANMKNNIGLDCGVYSGVSNYGKCTIISLNKTEDLEVHIHNFKKNIYNKILKIKNIKKIPTNTSSAIDLINNGCNDNTNNNDILEYDKVKNLLTNTNINKLFSDIKIN